MGARALAVDDGTLLTARAGLVLLKLFIPPHYYGSYLVFGPDGEPVGVIDEVDARVVAAADGRSADDLAVEVPAGAGLSAKQRLGKLVEAGLLVPGSGRVQVHWISPGEGTGTRHVGAGAKTFVRYFYDYFGGAFHETSPLIDSDRDFLGHLSPFFPEGEEVLCLDAGCGSGHYARAVAQRGHHVIACDINLERLGNALALQELRGKIQPLQSDLERLPLASGSVGFVMSNFVLEHVADPYAVMAEFARVLEPDGTLLLAVPNLSLRDTLASWLDGELPSLNFEHLRSFGLIPHTHPWCEPILDVLRFLDEHGVRVEVVQGVGITTGLWEPWASAISSVEASLAPRFSTTWPWNCLGEQSVIFGRKVR